MSEYWWIKQEKLMYTGKMVHYNNKLWKVLHLYYDEQNEHFVYQLVRGEDTEIVHSDEAFILQEEIEELKEVSSVIEAIRVCENRNMTISFNRDSELNKYVVLEMGFKKVSAKNLVEAVNRMYELYNTIPANYDKIPWYRESLKKL